MIITKPDTGEQEIVDLLPNETAQLEIDLIGTTVYMEEQDLVIEFDDVLK